MPGENLQSASALYVPLLHYPLKKATEQPPPAGLRPSESAACGCNKSPTLETIGEHWRLQQQVCGNLKQLPKFYKSLQDSPVVANYRRNSAAAPLLILEVSGILQVKCTRHMKTTRLSFEPFLKHWIGDDPRSIRFSGDCFVAFAWS